MVLKSKNRKYVTINCKGCNKEMSVYKGNLNQLSGYCKKCAAKNRPANRTTHGMSNFRVYRIWCKMKERCNNSNSINYKNYGGKGICLCKEWNESFIAFYNWSIQNGYQDNLSIDRIDSDKNYEPNNCRWASRITQNNNTNRNHLVSYNGETHTISQWCKKLKLPYSTLYGRIRKGWKADRIFNKNLERRRNQCQ